MNDLSYKEIITKNHITGEVLLSMKSKGDWNEIGINTFGDVRLLLSRVALLQPGKIDIKLYFIYIILCACNNFVFAGDGAN